MSMITASTWVPRGYAASFPTKYHVDDQELARISKLARIKLEDAKDDLKHAQNGDAEASSEDNPAEEVTGVKLPRSKEDDDDDLREYDLDHYDEDDDADAVVKNIDALGNPKSLTYHDSNADDPYLTIPDDDANEDDEREELQVLTTDNMVLAGKVEDEVAHLEVYIYEDEADNLYVHHDIMLPAIPLCLEWLDVPVGMTPDGEKVDQSAKGNFVAVGTFDPDVEIWDVDTIDCMYPNAILGQGGDGSGSKPILDGKKKRRQKSKKRNDSYHVDAVLSLAANRNHRTLLASASADQTVKLWDLSTMECAKSYSYHTDKVCSIEWHPKETTVLLSGSYDRTVAAADMRAPDAKVPRWGVESDVEAVRWNPHDTACFFVTTEDGLVHYYDVRVTPSSPGASKPIWKLQAHDKSVSSFDVNPTIPGYLVTGSTDREVKLWNLQPGGPSAVVSRNLDVGKVFTTKFAPDPAVAFRLAVAGSKGAVQIWDTSTNAGVRRVFAERIPPADDDLEERFVGVMEDASESEDDSKDGMDED